MMNDGATLDDIVHSVKPPVALAEKPYLQPVYDEPEFIVRNVWRLEGGWYDGIASHLKPAPHRAQAAEIAAMAGGADVLLGRALQKMSDGDLALAAHLIDWAVSAAPDNRAAHEARMRIYAARAVESASTMAHGIFRAAALESAAKAGIAPPEDSRMI
jgi:alkyl sulfatase BDS1-like metallo-beta-lactamase superfamily hydrolase